MDKIFREVRKFGSNIFFKKNKTINFPAHIHEDIELVYVKKGGGGRCSCDGKKYDFSEGSFFLSFPNQVHHYSGNIEGEYIVLIVKPTVLYSYKDVFSEGAPARALYSPDDDSAAKLMELACDDYIKYGFSPVTSAYLTALFGILLRNYTIDKSSASRDTFLKILQYCSANYRERITVADIANELKISRSTISHTFSEKMNMNFCEYINSLRLSDAEQLLENKNYSITEVADMSGFPEVRTFNRAFLKRYGISPSAYRKK